MVYMAKDAWPEKKDFLFKKSREKYYQLNVTISQNIKPLHCVMGCNIVYMMLY